MLECSALPPQWVAILNTQFDAVVVPDEFLVSVYTTSGVTIPIFVIPIPLYLEDFLNQPLKTHKNIPFVFGTSAIYYPRKNHSMIIDAFAQEFGNNPEVQLKLHGRGSDGTFVEQIQAQIKHLNLPNIELINKSFNQQDYVQFMKSLDCYVFLSKGEGFSITPREALALGIPCILSNNTAHTSLCNLNLVLPVTSPIIEPAYYSVFNQTCGHHFNCTKEEVRYALRSLYTHYQFYLDNNSKGREWTRQFLRHNLYSFYATLLKPKMVKKGNKNLIKKNCLITNSVSLYNKYLKVISM